MWSAIAEEFGGTHVLAREAKRVYEACEPGSAQQVRMISLIMDLCKTASASADMSNPAEKLSDEELRSALSHFLESGITESDNGKDQ